MGCVASRPRREPGASVRNSSNFSKGIKLVRADESWVYATALLDTQCQVGNWISKRLVTKLGKMDQLSTNFEQPGIVDVHGCQVRAFGVITLNWKWQRGTRNHECQFYVFPDSEHLDIIFGRQFIESENLLLLNPRAFCTLVQHNKKKKDDEAAVTIAKERQKQEKAALAERRKKDREERENQQGGGE